VTGSSERRNALETMLTLRFGEECAQVVQTGRNSIAAAARAISALDLEIHAVLVSKYVCTSKQVQKLVSKCSCASQQVLLCK
jgi:hypothetical protein